MSKPKSKLNARGQISVPPEVLRKLGVGPGSVLEWEEHGEDAFVVQARRYTMEDIHHYLFPDGPPTGKPADVKKAIEQHIREKYGRR